MRKAILSVTLAACVAALALAADVQIVPPRDGYLVVTGTLTATQVRTLNASPITVLPAVAAGKGYVIESMQLFMDFQANAYDSVGAGEDFALLNTAGSKTWLICDTVLCLGAASTNDEFGYASADNFSQRGNEIVSTSGINLTILSGEIAALNNDANGDSPISYRIRYRIVDTAF